MAVKISKRAEADLGKLGSIPVILSHEDGKTSFQLGAALVSVEDFRRIVVDANSVLTAIGEKTI